MSELTQILVESYKTRDKTKNREIIVLLSTTFFVLLLGFLAVKITNGHVFPTPIAVLIISGIGISSLFGTLCILVFAGAVPIKHKLEQQKKEQLTKKDKKNEELRKRLERTTIELIHERAHSDKLKRMLDWFTDNRGNFYKSSVDDE